jgi:ribosomal protein S18 acetylase RimI-like enzyme
MQVLRNKSAFYNLLSSRYEVMREGERAAKRVPLDDAINDADRMRLLWAHDSFRQKLEKAATMAKEPHVWKSKDNFSVCPQDASSVLQHAMITAQDVTTGNVVGFCEVAMLALPSDQQDECATVACAPTIANLATSQKHRRQGIASSLVKSAQQYVQRKWDREDLSLYVESANKGAIALYSKHGFRSHGRDSSGKDAQGEIYMTKALPKMETVGV